MVINKVTQSNQLRVIGNSETFSSTTPGHRVKEGRSRVLHSAWRQVAAPWEEHAVRLRRRFRTAL